MLAGKKDVSTFEQPNADLRFSAQESLKPLRQTERNVVVALSAGCSKEAPPKAGTENLKKATGREGARPRSSKMVPDEWTLGNCH